MSLDFYQQAIDALEDHGLPYALVAGAAEGQAHNLAAYNLYENIGEHNVPKIVMALRTLADDLEKQFPYNKEN